MRKNGFHNFFHPAILLVLLIVTVVVFYFLIPLSVRTDFIVRTPMGRWLTPSRFAIKKVYNIIHLPYWFKKTDLPVYNIFLSPGNQEELTASTPFDPEIVNYRLLLEEDKKYVNADFISSEDNYGSSIKLRYRGTSVNHWRFSQKSFRLKFPRENLFNGQKALNLIIAGDRRYFVEPLNSYRAKKMGMLSPDFKFVRVKINNRDFGVYLASEPWSKEFLARNGLIDTNNIFSHKDLSWPDGVNYFTMERISDWKSYTDNESKEFEELTAFISLIENADDEEFAEKIGTLFDLESFYRVQLLLHLAGSGHINDIHNFVFLFKKETGKFVLLPWDIGVSESNYHMIELLTLAKRIFSNDNFLEEYKKIVNDYVSDESNIEDDLAYYDGLYKEYFDEFYNDQAKIDSDYTFDDKVKQYRKWFKENFYYTKEYVAKLASSDFADSLKPTAHNPDLVKFDGSFKYFDDVFFSLEQFIGRNPQFKKLNSNSLSLPAGEHIFKDITIIPRGLYVIIEPGAELLFSPGASLISHSPVTAVGAPSDRIEMRPLSPDLGPWGGFGVINTGDAQNKFYYVSVSGGGAEPVINGVPYLSQFNLRNTLAEIYDSTFENGRSDDALHIVGGSVNIARSVVKNTSSDGIDFDFVKNGSIKDNILFNSKSGGNNGDGIDLSGTESVEISNNKIVGFSDKCISVGEKSEVVVENNFLVGCDIGIAVKDNSTTSINSNVIGASKVSALSLYRKKQEFIKGGNVEGAGNIFLSNNKDISVDEYSSLTDFVEIACDVKKDYDLRSLLPAYLYNIVIGR